MARSYAKPVSTTQIPSLDQVVGGDNFTNWTEKMYFEAGGKENGYVLFKNPSHVDGQTTRAKVFERQGLTSLSAFKQTVKALPCGALEIAEKKMDNIPLNGLPDKTVRSTSRKTRENLIIDLMKPARGDRIYGKDLAFPADTTSAFNLSDLSGDLLKVYKAHYGGEDIPGITQPFSYAGQLGTLFVHHCEDQNLHSVNVNHEGADKIWVIIAAGHYPMVANLFKNEIYPPPFQCLSPCRHKVVLLTPERLDRAKIPYTIVSQPAGYGIVVFPKAFHGGLNMGANFTEAVNFVDSVWARDYSDICDVCSCRGIGYSLYTKPVTLKSINWAAQPNQARAQGAPVPTHAAPVPANAALVAQPPKRGPGQPAKGGSQYQRSLQDPRTRVCKTCGKLFPWGQMTNWKNHEKKC